ncbi:MAG: glycosyltransferase family 39 protein [Candidatus Omnitrophica bacterium]|nr:glycosyltransferase family 39 protein [Candidatus Omnitrophota bacterium]
MKKDTKYVLILIVLSYFFFMFGNGIISLSDPDEVFYTLTAKEMVQKNSWMTPYMFGQPQFEKPILLYWLMRAGFLVFGINPFSARFFPAFFALLGVIAVYLLARIFFKSEKKAFLGALVLLSGGLYVGLARTVFTDMIFTVLILLALLCFYWGYSDPRRKTAGLILFFASMGLAVLAKGPLGFTIPFLTALVFLLIRKEGRFLLCRASLWGLALCLLICLPWYLLMIKKYGSLFTHEFFYNDHIRRFFEAEHITNDTWYFYPASMIGCIFPWSLFLAAGLFYFFRGLKRTKGPELFLACWIAVTFLTFQPAHSKLTSYILPLFPALAIVAGNFLYEAAARQEKRLLFSRLALATLLSLVLIPVGLLAASMIFKEYIPSALPVYFLIVLFVVWIVLLFRALIDYRPFRFIHLLALMVPIFLSVIPFIKDQIEPYLSSKQACEYLISEQPIGQGTIAASKPFLRGVRYYTGNEMAFFNTYAKNFFSPHPIIFLDTDEKAESFFRSQGVSFCVIKKNAVEDLERIARDRGFEITLLKKAGLEYIYRVEPLKKK